MKDFILAAVAFTALCFGTAALATSPTETRPFYAGIQAGVGRMDTKKLSSIDGMKVSNTTGYRLAGRLFGGYLWTLNNNFKTGVELGYAMYPENKYKISSDEENAQLNFKGYYFDFLGVGKYNFTPYFSMIGKAGIAYVHQKAEGKVEALGKTEKTSKKQSKVLPKLALGAVYDINEHFSLDLTAAYVFGKSIDLKKYENEKDKVASVSTILLGATYRF